MRLLNLFCSLALAGCSLFGPDDAFDDPFLAVYEVSLVRNPEVPPMTGRIGLTYYPSDVLIPGETCAGGTYAGRWELDDPTDRIAEGDGSVRGGLDCANGMLQLYLFDGFNGEDSADDAVFYRLEGTRTEDGSFEGTWEHVGSYPRGAFSSRLVREASSFPTVP